LYPFLRKFMCYIFSSSIKINNTSGDILKLCRGEGKNL
jgi:hypothetical protein